MADEEEGGIVAENKAARLKAAGDSFRKLPPEHRALCLCAFSVFLPFPITTAMVIGTVAWSLFQKQIRMKMFHGGDWIWLAVFCGLMLIVPLLYGRWIGFLAGIGIAVICLFLLFAHSAMTHTLYESLLDLCCLASCVSFLFAVTQRLFHDSAYRATAGMLNANYYGMVIEFVVLIAVSRLMSNPRGRWFYLSVIGMNIAGIFLCDCQSAWLSVVAGILVLLFMRGYRRQSVWFLAIAAVLVVTAVSVPGILPRWDRMPQTFATRAEIWSTAWKGFLAHPVFGQGLFAYHDIWEQYGSYRTYHAHSLYLDPLLSSGVVGMGVVIGYLGMKIRSIRYCLKQETARASAVLILAFCAATAVHGITDLTILWVQTGALFFLVLSGLALGGKPEAKRRNG